MLKQLLLAKADKINGVRLASNLVDRNILLDLWSELLSKTNSLQQQRSYKEAALVIVVCIILIY